MQTVGVIAEYNPFHLGHQYQLRKIREQTGADHIIIVMSGDFVQRGTPAWTDRMLRTKMALHGGADMVLELPVHFACASAEQFAYGGVSLIEHLGFVDSICFGSECGDLQALVSIAHFLVDREAQILPLIQRRMTEGQSYPAARAAVIADAFPELTASFPGLLNGANNILAIEYLKALYRLNSHMTPFTISRQGAGYHEQLSGKTYPSAAAIRSHYAQTGTIPENSMPKEAQDLLALHPNHFPMTENDLSDLLYYKLRISDDTFPVICDLTPELWKRIRNQLPSYQNATQFIDLVKTRQYTRTRIQRVLLHTLLNLAPAGTEAAYARLLGFRQNHSGILRVPTHIPIITKAADAARQLTTENARSQWEADLRAHDLYRYVLHRKYPEAALKDDFHTEPYILADKP